MDNYFLCHKNQYFVDKFLQKLKIAALKESYNSLVSCLLRFKLVIYNRRKGHFPNIIFDSIYFTWF